MGILSEFAAECNDCVRHFRKSKSTQLFFGGLIATGLILTTIGILGAIYTSSLYLFATILVIGVCAIICPIGSAFLIGMYMLCRAFVKG